MPPSLQPDDAASKPVGISSIEYDPETFPKRLDTLMADRESRTGTRLIFYGGVRERRQQALATLTRYATENVHQFRVPSLLSDQRMQTQNNLRKAFDHAAEERALLYFDKADSIFTHSHTDVVPESKDSAAPTTVEYFFDRVHAYNGVIVLGLQRKRHVKWTEDHVQVIVHFG